MRKYAAFVTLIAIIFTLSGCTPGADTPGVVNVAAASSLKDVLTEIKILYEGENPNIRLNFTFASSGTLQHQIEQGAPIDLFISAGKNQADALYHRGLTEVPQVIAGNELVVVVPEESKQQLASLAQLSSEDINRIALGNPDTVPAGQYAQEALSKAGLLDSLNSRLVLTKDVRQVMAYVETGNVDGGFVYRSDTLGSNKVKVVFTVPRELHSVIVYLAAPVKSSENAAGARNFLSFLQTEAARAVFKRHGFTEPQ